MVIKYEKVFNCNMWKTQNKDFDIKFPPKSFKQRYMLND